MRSLALQVLPLELIDIGERLRAIDEGHALLIAENIQAIGRLRTPIEVRAMGDRYGLIAGGHRIRAAQLLGWREIEAFVYEATDDEARLAEIDENLVRHDLNPLDRAVFLWERRAVYDRLHPETKKGGDRRSEKSKRHDVALVGFSRETADKSGLTQRTIQRALSIAEALPADIRSMIAGTPLAHKQSELLALVKVPADQRATVVEHIRAGAAPTVGAALAVVEGRRPDVETPEQRQLKRLMDAWFAAKSPSARRAFRDFVLGQKEVE